MLQSRTVTRLLPAIGAAILAIALFAPAAQAINPGYEQFKGCPSKTESPSSVFCVRSDVPSGHLIMGKKEVPIKNPLVIVGGINESLGGFTAGPGGGLIPVKQEVPGGIIGITGFDWLINFLGLEDLKLFATAELAGTPGSLAVEPLVLPIKVHLTNPILGNSCYIGSTASPITLKLITGTTSPPEPNKPITGREPEISEDALHILHEENGTFVDNSFAVPGASGCVLNLFGFIPISLNSFVNSQAGLPAAAGHNEAVENFSLQLTSRELVNP